MRLIPTLFYLFEIDRSKTDCEAPCIDRYRGTKNKVHLLDKKNGSLLSIKLSEIWNLQLSQTTV